MLNSKDIKKIWIDLFDHTKEEYMKKFGAQAWYSLVGEQKVGSEILRKAITQLAEGSLNKNETKEESKGTSHPPKRNSQLKTL